MTPSAGFRRLPRTAIAAGAAVLGLVVLLLYLQGSLGGHAAAPRQPPPAADGGAAGSTATVEEREIPDLVDWPGTVTARVSADVAPTVMARVLEVRVQAGSAVRKGDVIATLDARDLTARRQQAEAALAAATALARQADADLGRARQLFAKQAFTRQDLDAAEARAATAQAQAAQARDALAEARVRLGETEVRAPFDGVVVARLLDPGDTAGPGAPVALVQDPSTLRLEADVAEHCAASLAVGDALPVRVGSPPLDLVARIDELAPVADPTSRTRHVKALLPADAALRPGAFASLRLACGAHAALLVPASAVRRAGQLETVRVLIDGVPLVRSVRTGKAFDSQVEVLSGLRAGDVVVVEP
ncbi:efflux RND transporter periplasmic adaptor subunit [bacterium]|nr:efflux RND transporter periplasmic adaptor subunit [bacterium]